MGQSRGSIRGAGHAGSTTCFCRIYACPGYASRRMTAKRAPISIRRRSDHCAAFRPQIWHGTMKPSTPQLSKIISGGQTGADRAALDFAMAHNIPHGGWIPKGRRTEDGPLDNKYQLRELPDTGYAKRTERNVLDSDGTLIISHGRLKPSGGSALTRRLATEHDRPWIHVDMDVLSIREAANKIRQWINANSITVLNVAGPRADGDPDIYRISRRVLEETFTQCVE